MSSGGLEATGSQVKLTHELLHSKSGPGSDFPGWLDSPNKYDKEEFLHIQSIAAKICSNTNAFVVVSIGGSHLGARATVEFLKSPYYNSTKKDTPNTHFAGNSINSSALAGLLSVCEGKDVSINMISKFDTTTEPVIAFRMFREPLGKKYGRGSVRERIYCITGRIRGTPKELADQEGYETFVVPDDVGGRHSVLTTVGLLPIAVSGTDLNELMRDVLQAGDKCSNPDLQQNSCYQYAAIRNLLYRKGKIVELLVSYEPCLAVMCEWWRQLYGENEGEDQKSLFPVSVTFSTDLYFVGQYVRDGRQILFGTAILSGHTKQEVTLDNDPENVDGLDFLQEDTMSYINKEASEGTVLAHVDGGVSNIVLRVPDFSEKSLDGLIHFFEKACAISGHLLGVNPLDQPGVESYKKNMFALLGKPRYEAEKATLEARLKH